MRQGGNARSRFAAGAQVCVRSRRRRRRRQVKAGQKNENMRGHSENVQRVGPTHLQAGRSNALLCVCVLIERSGRSPWICVA